MSQPAVLMLEPDNDDRYITRSFFDEYRQGIHIDFVPGSDELMFHLDKCIPQDYPSLILLSGRAMPLGVLDLLKAIKTNEKYGHIPVVILSGVKDEKIVRESYAIGASSVIQKPDSEEETRQKITAFIHYWFDTVELV